MTWSGYSESGQGSQERGPGSFALDIPGMPRAQAAPASTSPVRAGVEGGGARISNNVNTGGVGVLGSIGSQPRIPDVDTRADPTAELLFKLGGARAQEMVKQREQELFVQGAARVAAGEAMVGIANEQPWYSQVFGDTALVEGARAYSVKAGVAAWTSNHLNNMPELAKRAPDEVPAYLSAAIQSAMTGDPGTDQALQAELLGQVPGLVKEHTRQHYLHLQNTAAEARGAALDNTFKLVQDFNKGSIQLDEQGYENLETSLVKVLTPAAGVSEQEHWKQVTDRARTAVAGGNIHLYRSLGDLGYLNKMPPDVGLSLLNAARQAAPAAMQEAYRDPTVQRLALRLADPAGMSDEDAISTMEQLNDLVAGISGVPRELVEAYTPSEALRARVGLQGRRAAADAALSKQVQKQLGKQAIITALGAADPATAVAAAARVHDVSRDDVHTALDTQFDAVPPEQRLGLVYRNLRVGQATPGSKALMLDAVSMLNNEKVDPAAAEAFIGQYINLGKDGRVKVSELFPSREDGDFIDDIAAARQAGSSIEAAVASARWQQRMPREYKAPSKGSVEEAVQKLVADKYTGLFMTDVASEEDLGMLTAVISPLAKRFSSRDPDARASHALAAAQREGLFHIVGNRTVFNSAPEEAADWNIQTLSAKRGNQNPEQLELALGNLFADKAEALGLDKYTVLRLPGRRGEAIRYHVFGPGRDGDLSAVVSTDDALGYIKDLNTKLRDAATKPTPANVTDITRTQAAPAVFVPN